MFQQGPCSRQRQPPLGNAFLGYAIDIKHLDKHSFGGLSRIVGDQACVPALVIFRARRFAPHPYPQRSVERGVAGARPARAIARDPERDRVRDRVRLGALGAGRGRAAPAPARACKIRAGFRPCKPRARSRSRSRSQDPCQYPGSDPVGARAPSVAPCRGGGYPRCERS